MFKALSLAYAPEGQRYRSQIQDASGTTSVWYVAGGAVIGQLTTRSKTRKETGSGLAC